MITYWIDFAAEEGQSFFQKVWTEKNYINLCIEIDCVVYNIKICCCRYVVIFFIKIIQVLYSSVYNCIISSGNFQ